MDINIAPTAVIGGPISTATDKVRVTNTGAVACKDVVQLYFTAPYTVSGQLYSAKAECFVL